MWTPSEEEQARIDAHDAQCKTLNNCDFLRATTIILKLSDSVRSIITDPAVMTALHLEVNMDFGVPHMQNPIDGLEEAIYWMDRIKRRAAMEKPVPERVQ